MSKTTTTARKRTIRFDNRVEIRRIDPHSTYTEEERSRSWYTPREFRFFRKNQQHNKTDATRSKFIDFILQQQRDEHEHQQAQHTRNRRTQQQQQQRDEHEHQQQLQNTRNRRLGVTRDLLREAEQVARTRAPVQPSRVSSFGQPIPLESSRAAVGGTANQRWSIDADIRQPPRRIATYPTPLKNIRRSPRVQQPQQQQHNQQRKPTEQRWSSNAKEAIPKQDLSPFMPLRHISNTMLCALR